MSFRCCVLFFAVVSCSVFAQGARISFHAENSSELLLRPKPRCRESPCPKMYRPVCGAMDDTQFTSNTRCVLNNKIRCAKIYSRALGKNVPKVRFLHNGPCKNEERSIIRLRDVPNESLESSEENSNSNESLKNDLESESDESYESNDTSRSDNSQSLEDNRNVRETHELRIGMALTRDGKYSAISKEIIAMDRQLSVADDIAEDDESDEDDRYGEGADEDLGEDEDEDLGEDEGFDENYAVDEDHEFNEGLALDENDEEDDDFSKETNSDETDGRNEIEESHERQDTQLQPKNAKKASKPKQPVVGETQESANLALNEIQTKSRDA